METIYLIRASYAGEEELHGAFFDERKAHRAAEELEATGGYDWVEAESLTVYSAVHEWSEREIPDALKHPEGVDA